MEKEGELNNVDHMLQTLGSDPENVALSLLFAKKKDDTSSDKKKSLQTVLRGVCSELFHRIEALNGLRDKLAGREDEPTLSGLTELYMGGEDEDDTPVDAETLFGQIELMNKALASKSKRSLKKLATSLEEGGVVRLLDEVSDSDESDDDSSQEEGGSSEDEEHAKEEDSGDESEDDQDDEERKRIEARMKRAMDDMDEDDDKNDKVARNQPQNDEQSENGEPFTDPAAEELNDGFFDINEMEKFADEEEEYLPEEAFGEEKPEEEEDQDKRSFHQKQREGDLDDNLEEESDDEDNVLLFKKETTVRRKRYRDEDEVEALYELYQDVNDGDEDDDSAMEAVNMTATDLYGRPNKQYYEKWNSKSSKKSAKSDDDSWNEYDFEQGDASKTGGLNEMGSDDHDNDEEDSDRDDNEDSSDEDGGKDEELAMKPSPADKDPKGASKTTDKLQKQTDELEREILAEKPWQMRGETSGTARPVDSLLDSTPEFEVATKQAPIITVESTMNLEEVIQKRILNEDWDDVIPRELPDVAWNKKRGELPEVSQEKSKLGLGELYEREYMKKALGYDADAAEKETEEEKAKNEIKSLFANLCSKLDALSNYHFAPRPVADEAEIRPVTQPAIAMEEVLPLHVSEARGVAPEEVYGGKRGRDAVLRGESELEQSDRKRLRSAKKAARRKARKEKLADDKLISKLQPGLGLNNPYEKRKMREELSVARAQGKITTGPADTNQYGKSGTFFQRMQQEAQQSIQGVAAKNTNLDESTKRRSKSSAVKL